MLWVMQNINPIPTVNSRATWYFSKGPKHINFSDGKLVFTFNGKLGSAASLLVRGPDMALADFNTEAKAKGTAQIYRANEAFLHFTLSDGVKNLTFTFTRKEGKKWEAVRKRKGRAL